METMKKRENIKIGVIGAGKMGSNHIRAINELNGMFDFVGAYDPVYEKALVAEKYGAKAYQELEELL